MDDPVDFNDINALKKAYERERNRRLELEDECDMLAQTVLDLQSKFSEYAQKSTSAPALAPESLERTANDIIRKTTEAISVDIYDPSTAQYADKLLYTIPAACGSKNALCANFLMIFDRNTDDNTQIPFPYYIIACGGVDMCVSLYLISNVSFQGLSQVNSSQPIASYPTTGPVLSLSSFKSRLAVGCMDGSFVMVSCL